MVIVYYYLKKMFLYFYSEDYLSASHIVYAVC